jgi:hypothetical protein
MGVDVPLFMKDWVVTRILPSDEVKLFEFALSIYGIGSLDGKLQASTLTSGSAANSARLGKHEVNVFLYEAISNDAVKCVRLMTPLTGPMMLNFGDNDWRNAHTEALLAAGRCTPKSDATVLAVLDIPWLSWRLHMSGLLHEAINTGNWDLADRLIGKGYMEGDEFGEVLTHLWDIMERKDAREHDRKRASTTFDNMLNLLRECKDETMLSRAEDDDEEGLACMKDRYVDDGVFECNPSDRRKAFYINRDRCNVDDDSDDDDDSDSDHDDGDNDSDIEDDAAHEVHHVNSVQEGVAIAAGSRFTCNIDGNGVDVNKLVLGDTPRASHRRSRMECLSSVSDIDAASDGQSPRGFHCIQNHERSSCSIDSALEQPATPRQTGAHMESSGHACRKRCIGMHLSTTTQSAMDKAVGTRTTGTFFSIRNMVKYLTSGGAGSSTQLKPNPKPQNHE